MAVNANTLERLAPPRERTGRRPSTRHRPWWDRLLGAITWYQQTLEVIAAVERVSPHRRAAVARAWLLETE